LSGRGSVKVRRSDPPEMAKKSKSRAMFEVVSSGKRADRGDLSLPAWMAKPEKSASATRPQAPARPGEGAQPAVTGSRPGALGQAEPVLSLRQGRLRLSLNYVSCGVALLGLALLLAVIFALGRGSAGPARGEAAETGKAVSPPVEIRQAGPATIPPAVGWISGKYYLIVRAMGGLTPQLRADAEHIARYCSNGGDDAAVIGTDREYLVWSLVPFDSPDSEEARTYAAQIHELGKRYKKKFPDKGYDFDQFDRQGRLRSRFRRAP